MGIEGTNANVDQVDITRIPDTAEDDRAFPTVLVREDSQLIANQGATHRTAAINYQHLAPSGFSECLTHQRVIFKQLERDDLATERSSSAVTLEHWSDNTHGACKGLLFVGIEKVGGFETHGES